MKTYEYGNSLEPVSANLHLPELNISSYNAAALVDKSINSFLRELRFNVLTKKKQIFGALAGFLVIGSAVTCALEAPNIIEAIQQLNLPPRCRPGETYTGRVESRDISEDGTLMLQNSNGTDDIGDTQINFLKIENDSNGSTCAFVITAQSADKVHVGTRQTITMVGGTFQISTNAGYGSTEQVTATTFDLPEVAVPSKY